MTACYYCGGIGRGCPECKEPKAVGPAPDGSLLMPTSVQRADGTWKLVDFNDKMTKVERHPIKIGIHEASWENQVLWLKCVQHEVGDQIQLELLREPSRRYAVLVSRTTFEFLPREEQHRFQAWDLSIINARVGVEGDPSRTAQFIKDYWKRREQVALDKHNSTTAMARGT
jgi:hypothetical protein